MPKLLKPKVEMKGTLGGGIVAHEETPKHRNSEAERSLCGVTPAAWYAGRQGAASIIHHLPMKMGMGIERFLGPR